MAEKITIKGELFSTKNHTQILTNRKTGRPFVMKSSTAKKAEKPLMLELQKNLPQWKKMIEGQPYPLFVVFKLYRATRRKYDFTNLVQGIADLMVKCEYLPDDNTQCFYPVPARDEVDKENPRTEIWLLKEHEVANLTREQLSML